jgi:hypothetical protein
MAFGSAIGKADGATVRLDADTGTFNAKIEAAERQWRDSVGSMSREALKFDLAQGRLNKALATTGAESAQTKRATIALRDAEEAARRSADRTTREYQEQERALGRLSRGALAGSGVFRNLGRSIAFASGSFLGGAGFIFAIRSVLSASKESELVLGQTKVALEATGLSWERYGQRIQTVIKAQSQLGFDDEQLLKTFSVFVRRTKDINEALRLNQLAVNVARGRYIDLETAQQIVLKASIGMAGQLRRLGLDVDKNATSTQLLTTLTQKYGGAAAAAADTATGAQDRLNVQLENAKEIIGAGLLPAVTNLANRLAVYLGDAENQARLQETVNNLMKDGETIVRGFAGALQTVRAAAKPVVDALGGIENTVKVLTSLWLAFKIKAVAGFVATALASRRASASMVADAAVAGRAWDVATRPRSMFVGGGGGAIPGGRRGGGLVGTALLTAGILFGPDIVNALQGLGGFKPEDWEKLKRAARTGQLTFAMVDELGVVLTDAQQNELRRLISSGVPAAPGEGNLGGGGIQPPRRRARGGGGDGAGGRTQLDIELDIARQPGATGPLRELRSFYARQIRALEGRKKLTDTQKEKLRALYGDLASVQSQLDAIADEGERKLDEQRKKAEERRRKERERREKVLAQLREQADRAEERAGDRRLAPGSALLRPALRHAAERRGTREAREMARRNAQAEGKGLTAADIRRMQVEFLNSLQGINNQFGGNLFGQLGTHAHAQTNLIREQNGILRTLASGVRHPGARYARNELTAAFDGVAF